KRDIGAPPDQFDDRPELAIVDADVEREAILSQQLHAIDKVGPQAEGRISLALEDAAYPLDARVDPHQRVQVGARTGAVLHRRPGDDPLQAWVLPRAVSHPLRFEQAIGRLDIDLDIDPGGDIDAGRVRAIFIQGVAPIQQLIAVDPADAKVLWVPEMNMGVDD